LEKIVRAIAVDDEPMALEILERHARGVVWLALQRTFISASEAMTWLRENPVDCRPRYRGV
jgi:hypothetical protein